MIRGGFHRSAFDSCVYYKKTKEGHHIYLLIYVDDMLLICKNMKDINELKNAHKSEFDMKDLGSAKRILEIDISRDRRKGTLTQSQAGYIQKVLREFGILESKVVSTPIPSHYKLKSAKGSITEA